MLHALMRLAIAEKKGKRVVLKKIRESQNSYNLLTLQDMAVLTVSDCFHKKEGVGFTLRQSLKPQVKPVPPNSTLN